MAISIIGLVGRTGAVVGSNFVGPMLLADCSAFLYIFASVIIGCTVAARIILLRLENYYRKQTLSHIEITTQIINHK